MRRRELLMNRNLTSLVSGLTAQADSKHTVTPPAGPRANYFPNVILRTHENRPVRFYDDLIRNKLVVINMMHAHEVRRHAGTDAGALRVHHINDHELAPD